MATILSIVWYKILPARFGGQKGIALFNEYLSKHHALVCLCSHNNVPGTAVHYRVLPVLPVSKWQFIDPGCWQKVRAAAVAEKATHIILEHPYHGIAALRAKKATGARLILHSHNIESLRFRETGRWWWRILYFYEKWVHRKADLVLFKTEAEQQYAINRFGISPDQCMIVPYGIEKKERRDHASARRWLCEKYGISESENILFFAGTLDYAPNAGAASDICHRLAPMLSAMNLNYRIIICGRNSEKRYQYLNQLSHPSVIMAGEVDDIDCYFAGADVFINPVQLGGGVQTKNIDALANHCNLVCFDNMLDKDTLQTAGDKIFPARNDDWNDFAKQIQKAIDVKNPTPERFFQYYYWENIIARLSARIDGL
jgi:polysaccharide biosynthesis protein PslH